MLLLEAYFRKPASCPSFFACHDVVMIIMVVVGVIIAVLVSCRNKEIRIYAYMCLNINLDDKTTHVFNCGPIFRIHPIFYLVKDEAHSPFNCSFFQLMRASGKVGNFLWKSTYFIKQVSLRNQILVMLDW